MSISPVDAAMFQQSIVRTRFFRGIFVLSVVAFTS